MFGDSGRFIVHRRLAVCSTVKGFCADFLCIFPLSRLWLSRFSGDCDSPFSMTHFENYVCLFCRSSGMYICRGMRVATHSNLREPHLAFYSVVSGD